MKGRVERTVCTGHGDRGAVVFGTKNLAVAAMADVNAMIAALSLGLLQGCGLSSCGIRRKHLLPR
jgi:hypothetical protein